MINEQPLSCSHCMLIRLTITKSIFLIILSYLKIRASLNCFMGGDNVWVKLLDFGRQYNSAQKKNITYHTSR